MARDPKSRLTDDGVQSERPSGLVPEEIAAPETKQKASDTDWLSMSTADPAFFLKDSNPD